jgi:hypothetical protein
VNRREITFVAISASFSSSTLLYLFQHPAAPLVFVASSALMLVWLTNRGLGVRDQLAHLMVWAVPSSFRNIAGGEYGAFPLSWFNILFIALCAFSFMFSMKRSRHDRLPLRDAGMFIPVLALVAGTSVLASSLLSAYPADAMHDTANVFAFILVAILVSGWQIDRDRLRRSWTISSLSMAFALCIQFVLYKAGGQAIGTVKVFPDRAVLCAIFNDSSFLSLYLAVGACMAAFSSGALNLAAALFLLAASALTTARTGLAAAGAAMGLAIAWRFMHSLRLRYVIAIAGMALMLFIAAAYLSYSRGGQAILADNGRFRTYASGWDNFIHYPLLGIGPGFENYANSPYTRAEFPHMTLLQLLAQLGLLGGLPLAVLAVSLQVRGIRRHGLSAEAAAILCCLIGSFFVPDMMNSRFLPLLYAGMLPREAA